MTGAGGTTVRIAASVLLGLGLLVATASVRLLLDGRRHLAEAERLQAAGEHDRALVALEDAARAYLPGSPYPRRALDRLALVARTHEMRGETAGASKCWEIVRRSILASRHVAQPNAAALETAERQIARLSTSVSVTGTGIIPARPDDPHPALALLLIAGLLAWLGGSAALLWGAGDRAASTAKRRVVAWLATLGGLGLWLAMSWIAG